MQRFAIVQPWGDKPGEVTVISRHLTAAHAFAELDRLVDTMVSSGMATNALELYVVNDRGERVRRPGAH